MAFINKYGQKISYDCQELIEELKQDIIEFGGDIIVEVVTEEKEGVILYKDYNFIDDDEETEFILDINEKMERMTASALLVLYEKENEIL